MNTKKFEKFMKQLQNYGTVRRKSKDGYYYKFFAGSGYPSFITVDRFNYTGWIDTFGCCVADKEHIYEYVKQVGIFA
jgi:hypothetical protein